MDKVKNIVFGGLSQGWSYSSTLYSVAYEIASDEEALALSLWTPLEDLPQLADKAKKLYEKYKKEFYKK